MQNDERIEASDVEFQLSRPSFTINTLLFLKDAHQDHEFSIIMEATISVIWINGKIMKTSYRIIKY